MLRFCILISALLLGTPALASAERQDNATPREAQQPAHAPVIAVADFTGEDPATGRFLADTLLTDLAQSHNMRLVERNELRRAIAELKVQDTGLFEPQQVQALGRLVRADKLLVGSYLIRENQIIINARLLEVSTGRVMEGGASNITGDTHSLLSVVHRLAHIFHRHVTGSELVIDGEGAEPSSAPSPVRPPAQTSPPQPPPAPMSDNTYRIGTGDSTRKPYSPVRSRSDSSADNGYRIQETRQDTIDYPIYTPLVYSTPPIVPVYTPTYFPSYLNYSRYAYWNYYPNNRHDRFVRAYPQVRITLSSRGIHIRIR